MNFQSYGFVSSGDKLKTLYLHLQKTHGHQTESHTTLRSREQHEITSQFEKTVSSLSQDLWPLNLAELQAGG